jgi:putative membrane protein
MGAADVIPGVSGGTVAFITGIYEELIYSIRAFDLNALKLLGSFQVRAFWKKVNGSFLLVVLAGIVTSLITVAKVMGSLLERNPISIWSFFFGLILVSSPLILRNIKQWNYLTIMFFAVGISLAYIITTLPPAEISDNLFFVFLAGALAVCAIILPGISMAFALLLLGKYEFVVGAIVNFDMPVIIVFVLGCLAGLAIFSHFLGWLLDKFRFSTLAFLAGFMVGSLNKVWPWKEVIAFRIDLNGIQVPAFDKNIWPGKYFEITGHDPQLFYAILFAAVGVFLVVAIEKTAAFLRSKN